MLTAALQHPVGIVYGKLTTFKRLSCQGTLVQGLTLIWYLCQTLCILGLLRLSMFLAPQRHDKKLPVVQKYRISLTHY